MHLIVGLGNPGSKYEKTRHNLGFMVVDRLVADLGCGPMKDKFKARWAKAALGSRDAVLLEPMTYMNLSGESVQAAMQFFRVELPAVVCIHDELDLPWGEVRVKVGGGTAGHNGLKSMVQHCGGPAFVRVRMGIGRPEKGTTESWVLGEPNSVEKAELPDFLTRGADVVRSIVEIGAQAAMNRWNGAAAR